MYRDGTTVVTDLEARKDTLPSVCGMFLLYKANMAENKRACLKNYNRLTVSNILKGVDNAISHGDKYYPEELDDIITQLKLSEVTSMNYTDAAGIPLRAKQTELMQKATSLVQDWVLSRISQEQLNAGYELTLKALKEAIERFPEDMAKTSCGRWGRVFYRVKCKPKKLDGWLKRSIILTIIGVMFDFGPTPLLGEPAELKEAFAEFLKNNPKASYELQAEWIFNKIINKKYRIKNYE